MHEKPCHVIQVKMTEFFPTLIDGNGYVARQTSKDQTITTRFMLEGTRLRGIFCFALIHYV